MVGLTEDSFRSLTEDEISKFTALYRQPEIFAQLNGEIVAIPVEPRVEPERSAENTYELFQLKDAPETKGNIVSETGAFETAWVGAEPGSVRESLCWKTRSQ